MGLQIIDANRRGDVLGTSPLRFFYGVIRTLQIVRIYRVQIPEVERCTLQGEDDTDIQITDGRTFYDLQITEVPMVDYRCTDGGLQMYRWAAP